MMSESYDQLKQQKEDIVSRQFDWTRKHMQALRNGIAAMTTRTLGDDEIEAFPYKVIKALGLEPQERGVDVLAEIAKLSAERDEARAEVERWKEKATLAQQKVNDFWAAIPETFGEFVMRYGFEPPCESHEWDNHTAAENAAWLVSVLACEKEAVDRWVETGAELRATIATLRADQAKAIAWLIKWNKVESRILLDETATRRFARELTENGWLDVTVTPLAATTPASTGREGSDK